MQQLVSIKEASEWASKIYGRDISTSNISYLIQYGKVKKYGSNGSTQIDINDLKNYYESFRGTREMDWKKKLGNDVNWALSFDHLREIDTTKHVHRLHPYKGKYIPQLVEYFLDDHTDEFKKEIYFHPGDIVLDPFIGSGTTSVQANELGIHSIGVDISRFNILISETKLLKYDLPKLLKYIERLKLRVDSYELEDEIQAFESELLLLLNKYNIEHFPSPEFKRKIITKKIDEESYAKFHEEKFLEIYNKLIKKYNIKLKQDSNKNFLDKWYISNVRKEIDFAFSLVSKVTDPEIKKILAVILSRAIRSCRATTHSDLATLVSPQLTTYYCYKHKKICKPLFSIKNMLSRYSTDTFFRLKKFDSLRTNTFHELITADSRTVNIEKELQEKNEELYKIYKKNRIKGIFTSPPYVGQIDYHEQHAYAYDLMGFKRLDDLEIGPLYKGQGREARESYVEGITQVLLNSKKYLAKDYDIFLVANDKYNLYPTIAEKSGMKIVNRYKRPVLNRTERDRNPYSEIIFHFKGI